MSCECKLGVEYAFRKRINISMLIKMLLSALGINEEWIISFSLVVISSRLQVDRNQASSSVSRDNTYH